MRFAVVGHPLTHSKSPAMFKAAFDELSLQHSYVKEDVSPEELPALIDKMRSKEYAGLSITVPYKETVIPLVDELTEEARKIQAVNTIYISNGKIVGDNTDWIGFKKALDEAIDITNKRILICGAGGAARACLFALRDKKEFVTLTNRSEDRGRALANEFDVAFAPLSSLPRTDILINATSAGLSGELPVPLEYLKTVTDIFDLLYGETPLVKAARALGILAVDGKEMLLYQGAEQFKRFTSIEAPLEAMRKAI